MTSAGTGAEEVAGAAALRAWRNAVLVIFALSGMSISSWAARLPAARDALGVDPGKVGLLILCISIGAVAGLGVTAAAARRWGHRVGIAASLATEAAGLFVSAVGAMSLHSIPVTVAGLFLLGLGNGVVDVMMNVSGAGAERRLGRTLMPLFHACYSLGTVIGAAIGAVAAAAGVSVVWHFLGVGLLIAAGGVVAVRFVPAHVAEETASPTPLEDPALLNRFGAGLRARLTVWRDVRLVVIGLVMLGMAFAEGSANDWITLAGVDGHGVGKPSAALLLDSFMVAMTLGRVAGGPFVDRVGRVWAIRVTAGLGVVGLLLFILGTSPVVYAAGTVLWGLGASLGFPLGISAASDDESQATSRVAAVAMIGYVAFLVGPPFIGLLADRFGLLHALYLILVLLAVAFLSAPALRPRPDGSTPAPSPGA